MLQGLAFDSKDETRGLTASVCQRGMMPKILRFPPRNRGWSFWLHKAQPTAGFSHRRISSMDSNMQCILPSQQPTGSMKQESAHPYDSSKRPGVELIQRFGRILWSLAPSRLQQCASRLPLSLCGFPSLSLLSCPLTLGASITCSPSLAAAPPLIPRCLLGPLLQPAPAISVVYVSCPLLSILCVLLLDLGWSGGARQN